MTTSTTRSKEKQKQKRGMDGHETGRRNVRKRSVRRRGVRLWAVAFWLLVWQIAAMWIGQEILLASPVSVLQRLFQLCLEGDFWASIAFSFVRIILGFLLACLCGVIFAAVSSRFLRFRELLAPLMAVVKSTPVASFIILVLIWVPSRNLSIFISFLMVTPIIYANVLGGIEHTDRKLLEMADVFRVPFGRRLRYIYLPQTMPFFRAACSVSLGLCWKAGVAAEVIGIPKGSVGERLYQAKIYLETPDLFAWTVVIILISLLFEKLFLFLLDLALHRFER